MTVVAMSSGDFATADFGSSVVVALPPDPDVREVLDRSPAGGSSCSGSGVDVSVGVLVALGSSAHEPAVLAAARAGPLHVVRRCVDIADLLATAASRQADVAWSGPSLPGLDAETVERVQSDGVAVVGVLPTSVSADEAVLRAQGVGHIAAVEDMASLVEL